MAAQKREAGKNYIGLLSDELDAPYTLPPRRLPIARSGITFWA